MSREPKSQRMREFDVAVGRRIERARRARAMRAKELARAVGVAAMTLYRYEAGLSSCPAAVLSAIGGALGVPVGSLLVE